MEEVDSMTWRSLISVRSGNLLASISAAPGSDVLDVQLIYSDFIKCFYIEVKVYL
jgi:hypothetical protein